MCNTRPKQTERVLAYMRKHGSITQREADRKLGVLRLPSRINELKKEGYIITGKMEAVKNRYGEKCYIKRYRVVEKEDVLS
jgi:hypothetical protein